MEIASTGIDLGKTTFYLVALNDQGKVVVRKNSRIDWQKTTTARGLPNSGPGSCFQSWQCDAALHAHLGYLATLLLCPPISDRQLQTKAAGLDSVLQLNTEKSNLQPDGAELTVAL